ncbi:MAG: nucleoside deaminase [Phycisphaerales bacterium]|jgi:cytosine deaminase|nr:nucleoside deaminase [Phycisphaerales bacterium]
MIFDNTWLDVAIEQAEKSWGEGGIPIGATLVDQSGSIVSRGHNERVQRGDPTAHAEVVCIRNAGRRRDWNSLTLVSTLSPCVMCVGTTLLFGIKTVFIGENKNFLGAEELLCSNGVKIQVLQDPTCISLMQRLKDEKPDLWAEDIGL